MGLQTRKLKTRQPNRICRKSFSHSRVVGGSEYVAVNGLENGIELK